MNTKYLQNQNGQIAYEDTGSGPLVVCVPSLGDVRSEYRFLAPRLVEAGYRVLCMDVRGHGESSTEWDDFSVAGVGSDLLALIRAQDAGPAVVVSNSMAGGASVWAAAESPEWIAGLMLIDPVVRGESTWQNLLLYRALFARPWGPAAWVKYYTTLYPTHKPADFDSYIAALRANLKEPGRMEALQKMIAASKSASEARLPKVTAPARILMGSKDPDFKDPEAEARWLAESLHAEYLMIPNAGHYPHVEMPEVTAPLVLSFLASLKETWGAQHVA